jgi:hypothetical protein
LDRRDYLLRLLEQMGRAVARVRELLTGQFVAEAAREIEVVAQQAGVPLALVRVLSADSLSPVLSTAGEPDSLKRLLAAEYLYVEALRHAPDAVDLFARALELYRGVGPLADAALTAAVTERITDLERRLVSLDPPLSRRQPS